MTELLNGDALHIPLADKTVQCVVTSPPYYGLRDYGVNGQMGLEKSPEEYVAKTVQVFREVWRVLRDDGTLWLNIGDSYWGGKGSNACNDTHIDVRIAEGRTLQRPQTRIQNMKVLPTNGKHEFIKSKDLIGIPWRVAFALQADGWYLRSDIIWAKNNPMPESVQDRPTKSHEYLFLLSKSQHYYYDAEAVKEPTITKDDSCRNRDITKLNNTPGRTRMGGLVENNYDFRNKRTVWTIPTAPYKGAHFATYPPALVEPCIKAGSKIGDLILDPFCGSGTTGEVAIRFGRKFVGIELNPTYIELARKRLSELDVLLPI